MWEPPDPLVGTTLLVEDSVDVALLLTVGVGWYWPPPPVSVLAGEALVVSDLELWTGGTEALGVGLAIGADVGGEDPPSTPH